MMRPVGSVGLLFSYLPRVVGETKFKHINYADYLRIENKT